MATFPVTAGSSGPATESGKCRADLGKDASCHGGVVGLYFRLQNFNLLLSGIRFLTETAVRILLVEDDVMVGRGGTLTGLEQQEWRVDWLADAATARLALMDHSYTAILLDLKLPRGNGLDLLEVCSVALRRYPGADSHGERQTERAHRWTRRGG